MRNLKVCLVFIAMYAFPCGAQKTGIGTLTPANMLSVNGTVDISDSLAIGTPSPAKRLSVNGDALIHTMTVGRGGSNVGSNTALGYRALLANDPFSSDNTGIGYDVLRLNISGSSNTAVGAYALGNNTTGYGNTALGAGALTGNSTGFHNTAVGSFANVSSGNLTNATAIGADATVSASNSLVLGSNANVGIGVSAPTTKLEVNGVSKTSNFQMISGSVNGHLLKSDASGLASWASPTSLETDPEVNVINLNSVPRVISNGTLFTSAIGDNGTNVNIGGIVSPTDARLTVVGSINEGIRLLSGSATAHTSVLLGRTSTEATLGIAAGAQQFATNASAGDLVFRTENTSQQLILNTGAGSPGLALKNGKVSLGTINHINTLDVSGNLAVGAAYSGTNTAPSNGAIIEGNLGIGSTSIAAFGRLRVSTPNAQTVPGLHHISFFSTQEAISSNPFALRFSFFGGATNDDRYGDIQTTDINLADGGNLLLQPENGYVGIGRTDPVVGLDVNGGIRTSFSGTTVIEFDAPTVCLVEPDCTEQFDISLPAGFPSSWTSFNTIIVATVADGNKGKVVGARILNSTQFRLWVLTGTGQNQIIRINYFFMRINGI